MPSTNTAYKNVVGKIGLLSPTWWLQIFASQLLLPKQRLFPTCC
jgi:hypothetical protein